MQNWLSLGKTGCISAKWLYLGKTVVFVRNGCVQWAKLVNGCVCEDALKPRTHSSSIFVIDKSIQNVPKNNCSYKNVGLNLQFNFGRSERLPKMPFFIVFVTCGSSEVSLKS